MAEHTQESHQAQPEPEVDDASKKVPNAEPQTAQPTAAGPPGQRWAFLKSKKAKIIMAVVGGFVVLTAILVAVPPTRYAIAGVFIKKDISVEITDNLTKKVISNARVSTGGISSTTGSDGKAVLRAVPVGPHTVLVSKKYYKDFQQDIIVHILSGNGRVALTIQATGRQVPIRVVNKISGLAVKGAVVTVLGTSATTDGLGATILVLPANKTSEPATITANGYNNATASVVITEQPDSKNTLAITLAGKIYFLSKRTGKIDVMKSDLDGQNAQMVLAGTGKESDSETTMLSARDWKYQALSARRDSDQPKLYLIDATKNDAVTVIDQGNAQFTSIGWDNQYFIYSVRRNDVSNWQPKQSALKSYNAQTGAIAILDETAAEGSSSSDYAQQRFDDSYIVGGRIVYTTEWNVTDYNKLSGKSMSIKAVDPNGTNKSSLKDFALSPSYNNSISTKPYAPLELLFEIYSNTNYSYYAYEVGKISQNSEANKDSFGSSYPTYLTSPSGQQTFWSDQRDGKNTLFVGDSNGGGGQILAQSSDFKTYGWYTDSYVLESKNDSELYIAPATGPLNPTPLKITDYHKPNVYLRGYGYGYGGL